VAIEANATDKAVATDEVHKANDVDKAKADEAIKAIELPLDSNVANANNKIHLADKAEAVNKAKSNKVGMSIKLLLLLPFSLTKYSAIFAEVIGCFGIFNNQLGGLTCWIDLNKKQHKILCVQRCHNCWIVMDVKQQETWCVNSCSRNC
jgi:hypothetical protein